jgi:hypothetical protein
MQAPSSLPAAVCVHAIPSCMLNCVMTGQHTASFAQVPEAPASPPPAPLDVPASSFVPLEEPPFELLPPPDPLDPLDPLEPPLDPLLDPLEPLLDPLEDPLLLELSLAIAASLPSSPVPKPPVLFDEHAASNPKMPPDANTNLLIFSIVLSPPMVSRSPNPNP